LDTGLTSADINDIRDAFGIYSTAAGSVNSFEGHGYNNNGSSAFLEIYTRFSGINRFFAVKGVNISDFGDASTSGLGFYLIASTGTASADRFGMLNGGTPIAPGSAATSTTSGTEKLRLFARNTTASEFSSGTASFFFVGLNTMTATEAEALSWAVNAFMAKLGANTYAVA